MKSCLCLFAACALALAMPPSAPASPPVDPGGRPADPSLASPFPDGRVFMLAAPAEAVLDLNSSVRAALYSFAFDGGNRAGLLAISPRQSPSVILASLTPPFTGRLAEWRSCIQDFRLMVPTGILRLRAGP